MLWLVALLLAVGAVWGLRSAFGGVRPHRGPTSESQVSRVAAIHGGATSLLTVSMLAYLSVRSQAQGYPTPDDAWVYLAETRYYVPLAMALFVGMGWFVERARSVTGRRRPVILAGFALIGVLATGPAVLRAKRFVEIHLLQTNRPSRALDPALSDVVAAQLRPPADGARLVYLDDDERRRQWASMLGAVVIDPQDVAMLNRDVRAETTVVLAYSVAGASDHMRRLRDELLALGAKETGLFEETRFISFHPL